MKTNEPPPEIYLKLSQICGGPDAMMPISKSTFWRLIRANRLPPGKRLGHTLRVWAKSDILRFIEEAR